jgi:hypothetical protein
VAARIRRELGVDVDEVPGAYGEFTVLVDGEPIRRANPITTALAILPPTAEILAEVRKRLGPG